MAKCTKTFGISLILSLTLSTISCTKQVPIAIDEQKLEREKVLHVVLNSRQEYMVRNARIEGEYLIGTTWADVTKTREKEIKILLNDIKSIKTEQFDKSRTIITLTISTLFVAAYIYLALQFQNGFE